MAKKENVTKAKETAKDAAIKVLQAEAEKDIQACIAELKKIQEQENEVLKKYGCVRHITGKFLNNQIESQFIIDKAK